MLVKKSYHYLREILTAERSPRQIARGVAIGIAIGLIPKANLICALFVLLLFMLRTNLAAGFVCALVLSWISPALDPLTDGIGMAVLSWGPLQPLFGGLYKLPLVAWTSFNNSVVAGNLILALAFMGPTYLILSRRLGRSTPISTDSRPGVVPASAGAEPANFVPPPKLKKRQKFVIGSSTAVVGPSVTAKESQGQDDSGLPSTPR